MRRFSFFSVVVVFLIAILTHPISNSAFAVSDPEGDTFGQEPPGRNHCGAIYDCQAPRIQAVHKAGEWNHAVLICRGPWIDAYMNGHQIIRMNLDQWTEPNKNPDGSPNKYGTAYKDMPRVGHIGLQDHGNPIWYRNIRVKPLTP